MMDEKGRVWFTARVRPPENPDFCKKGSSHPSAKVFPINSANRHLSMYDPKTKKFTLISTCFSTHHLVFAEDANHTLWTSAGGPASGVVGWLNRKMFEETGDEQKSQGWTPLILDTNGNGKRDEWVEPNQAGRSDERQTRRGGLLRYRREPGGRFGVGIRRRDFPAPSCGSTRGQIRRRPRSRNSTRCRSTPAPTASAGWTSTATVWSGLRCRAVIWRASTGASAKLLNGPTATGKHCPEGWTLHTLPGPNFESLKEPGSAEASYYTWVDQFDTFGLGKDVPIATGNLNDSLLALVDGKFVNLRVPYPLGFYAKWMDGTNRRPEGRLEGQRPVGDHRHAHAIPHGRRQGHAAKGREVPVAARSVGEISWN